MKSLPPEKVVFTSKEIAEITTLNPSYVRLLIAKGIIKSKSCGRRRLVTREFFLEWFNNLPTREA